MEVLGFSETSEQTKCTTQCENTKDRHLRLFVLCWCFSVGFKDLRTLLERLESCFRCSVVCPFILCELSLQPFACSYMNI
jgi:hypothetical protein